MRLMDGSTVATASSSPDANHESGEVSKRTRKSASKVRTGCSTCKARRVKCDEARPRCRQCTFGDRQCGYTGPQAASKSRHTITVYLPPAPSLGTNDDEDIFFFQHQIAASLDGQFDSKFWSGVVLQLAQSEESVQCAVAVISLSYRDVTESLQLPLGFVNASHKSRHQWSRAAKSLSLRIQQQPDSRVVPLVCCILFTCAELLKGSIELAMLHARNGLKILADSRAQAVEPLEGRKIEDDIVPMFSRLRILCSLAGGIAGPTYQDKVESTSKHKRLADSRQQLADITVVCLQFINTTTLRARELEVELDDIAMQAKLQSRLEFWREQLEELLISMRGAGVTIDQRAVSLLLIQYKTIYIWLRVCTSIEETATDRYHADFLELIQHAEGAALLGTEVIMPQLLSFDIHTLAPLYYATIKCRFPATRRRALRLLRLSPRREGCWNAHYAYMTAQRLIEVEEMHVDEHGLPMESSRIHNLPLPNDDHRIQRPDKHPTLWSLDDNVVLSPTCPGTLETVIMTKPWGLLGEWHYTKEYIEI